MRVERCVARLGSAIRYDLTLGDGQIGQAGIGTMACGPRHLELIVAGTSALAVDGTCIRSMNTPQHRREDTRIAHTFGRATDRHRRCSATGFRKIGAVVQRLGDRSFHLWIHRGTRQRFDSFRKCSGRIGFTVLSPDARPPVEGSIPPSRNRMSSCHRWLGPQRWGVGHVDEVFSRACPGTGTHPAMFVSGLLRQLCVRSDCRS